MIRILIFVSVALLVIIGLYLLKRATVFLPIMHKGTSDSNKQFLHQFGIFYLLLAVIGVLVAIFDIKIFSLLYIFSLLVISAIFSVMFAKKIL